MYIACPVIKLCSILQVLLKTFKIELQDKIKTHQQLFKSFCTFVKKNFFFFINSIRFCAAAGIEHCYVQFVYRTKSIVP